jgi:hypothetical protein
MTIATLPPVFPEFDKKWLANFQSEYLCSLSCQQLFAFKTIRGGRHGKAMLGGVLRDVLKYT